uniref:Eukaryotic translation initiation factor 4B n=1 Tax=Saimiri boliviensis boliviensis TaxID=39432 RepID=A0A2K6T906_SAIBB
MVASAKKKNKKGNTISLTDFLAEDMWTGRGSTYISKPVSWAEETDDLEGDASTTWHSNADNESNINQSRLPKSPPYTAFLGNLTYDVTEESIKEFFRGLNISTVRLPHEPSDPERLKGFGYAEFENLDSLFSARGLNGESLGNRRIPVDVADKVQNKGGCIQNFFPLPYRAPLLKQEWGLITVPLLNKCKMYTKISSTNMIYNL